MNENALRAAEVLENNVKEAKEAIAIDNDKMSLQAIKRMNSTIKQLKKSIKDNAKLKKNLAKNVDKSAIKSNLSSDDQTTTPNTEI